MQKPEVEAHSWSLRKSGEAAVAEGRSRCRREKQEMRSELGRLGRDRVCLAGPSKALALLCTMWEVIVGF